MVDQSVQEFLTEYLELHPDVLDSILSKSLNALKVQQLVRILWFIQIRNLNFLFPLAFMCILVWEGEGEVGITSAIELMHFSRNSCLVNPYLGSSSGKEGEGTGETEGCSKILNSSRKAC